VLFAVAGVDARVTAVHKPASGGVPGLPGGAGGLAARAERSGRRRDTGPARGSLRFAFYGRVSTEDWQDPVTSRARQRERAGALVRGHGVIVAEFFEAGQSRTVAWGRRPQAAALVAQLADPGPGWDAIVAGEYERAFHGSQYALMAPLSGHYEVQLWRPEAPASRRRRTRRGTDVRLAASTEEAVEYLHENKVTLTYDHATGSLPAHTSAAAKPITGKAS
jgi:hypothetical protein